MPIVNGEAVEYGCYVDGVNGQYCSAIVVHDFAFAGPVSFHARHAASLKLAEQSYPSYQMFKSDVDSELTLSVHDEIEWAYEQVESWLNDHTDEGWWGFNDGDFGLWHMEDEDA